MLTDQQKKICSCFEKASATGTLRHSYIIKGDKGIGKKYILNRIFKLIMCSQHNACGQCNQCHTVDSGANPDIMTISNGEKKTIEIQKIRDLIKNVYIKPAMGAYKIFVIENAHLMEAASQNALLKVIEEPPHYAVFILLCDNLNAILPTILSRVMLLELASASTDELKQIYPLEKCDEYMYSYCLGNIGMLKDISCDEEFKTLRAESIASFVTFMKSDAFGVYALTDFWVANKEKKEQLINILTLFLRDVVLIKSAVKDCITNTDKLNEIQTVSELTTMKKAFRMLELVLGLPAQLGKYGDMNMAVQNMFIRFKEEIND